jgi:hypothetical protein
LLKEEGYLILYSFVIVYKAVFGLHGRSVSGELIPVSNRRSCATHHCSDIGTMMANDATSDLPQNGSTA